MFPKKTFSLGRLCSHRTELNLRILTEPTVAFPYLNILQIHATKSMMNIEMIFFIQQFVLTSPHDGISWQEFDSMLSNAEEFNKMLGLPYRSVLNVNGL